MGSQKNPIPKHASVVVIGGGAMGCSTLYHLAKAGVKDAILIERNQLTSGTTWHSAAQVRALRSTKNMTHLIKYSISLYKELEKETGQNTGWINKGSLSIATNPQRLIHIKRQEALAKLFGVHAVSITKQQAKKYWPHMQCDDIIGAVWSPDDGRVSPSDLCAAFIKGAKNHGARIFENTALSAIHTKNNAITAIETNQGTIKCDNIVICTGLWSKNIAEKANVDAPIWPCEHFYLLTRPIKGIQGNLPTLSDHDSHLYIRDDSGGLLIGCFEPKGKPIAPEKLGEEFSFQLLNEDWAHFEPMMENALHRLPILHEAEVKMLLNGPESFTPDGTFLLGESAQTKGLFLGCGMNSVGIASAGGAGMALAHNIIHGETPFDLHEVDPKRFAPEYSSIETLAARVPEILGKHYAITYPNDTCKTARNLKLLPLHQQWENHHAHFGQIYAWEIPLYFNKKDHHELTFDRPNYFYNIRNEVTHTTQYASLFDQSALGKIYVSGENVCRFLDEICTNNMNCTINTAVYTAMLNDKGGFLSDFIALRNAEDEYLLFVGSRAIKRDFYRLKQKAEKKNIKIKNVTENYATLALMGPESKNIMQKLKAQKISQLKFYNHTQTYIDDIKVRAVRFSYVGEYGWEITCRKKDAVRLYQKIISQGNVKPAGLLAQTSMRIEKKFLAYGHEIDTDIDPFSAGYHFIVKDKKNFIGKKALQKIKKNPTSNHIIAIRLYDKNATMIGNEPIYKNGKPIGRTTSAAYGFRINAPIALARIQTNEIPSNVDVNIAGKLFKAQSSTQPLI